ncbi:MAG: prolyl oligopeptidase family serine peptidase [Parachlamydia sp.]|nr:prolyl oligopeptidase family serine peptidase [Parachlamydia sp.]
MFRILISLLCLLITSSWTGEKEQKLEEETRLIMERSAAIAKLWNLEEGVEFKELTEEILASAVVSEARKELIVTQGRRFFLFTYPSEGVKVKATISFVADPHEKRTLVNLRGGNRLFGLPSPASDISCMEDLTVLTSAYRGRVSEGEDEFGGAEVHDIKALIDFIPELERRLAIQIQSEKMFLLGSSRGGMQMFLALGRYPELQQRFSKVASLSGLLDIRATVTDRADMKQMFMDEFGLVEANEEEWLNLRDPLLAAEKIQTGLPILIIQTADDLRVELHEGYHMVDKLTQLGHQVTYWEFETGGHCLADHSDRISILLKWFLS